MSGHLLHTVVERAAGLEARLAAATAGTGGATEVALLVTCERSELYVATQGPVRVARALHEIGLDRGPAKLLGSERATVVHLLRVASGLESRLLGECHILGQVARAGQRARSLGVTGLVLDRLFTAAVQCGRLVRRRTPLGRIGSSCVTLAVDRILAHRDRSRGGVGGRTLVLGSGALARELVRALDARGTGPITLAARHPDRARTATGERAVVVGLESLPRAVASADVLVTATSSPRPLVGPALVAGRRRPLLIVDLSVPANVEASVRDVPGVTLLGLHELDPGVSPTRRTIREAERIVDAAADGFMTWHAAVAARGRAPVVRRAAS